MKQLIIDRIKEIFKEDSSGWGRMWFDKETYCYLGIAIGMLALVIPIIIFIRMNFVHRKRMEMIDIIADNNLYDYLKPKGLFWSVSYDYMMRHFWIWPISRMWPAELQKLLKGKQNEKS